MVSTPAQFKDHRGDAFVAARLLEPREEAGYCVTRVLFDQGRPYGELVYMSFLTEGWQDPRPSVDVVVAARWVIAHQRRQGGHICQLSIGNEAQCGFGGVRARDFVI
jgi:hypothetical protein